jgi:hypothetical protein
MKESELDVTQAILVHDYPYEPSQSSQLLALFDDKGNPVDFTSHPAGGPTSLTDLTDVTGVPGIGKAPISDSSGDFPLTEVATRSYVNGVVDDALGRWAVLGSRVSFVSDISSPPWEISNESVVMTPDGVQFGPYPDSGQGGGTLRFHDLDGEPFSVMKNFACNIRYQTHAQWGVGREPIVAPYLRVFLKSTTNPNPDDPNGEWSAIHNPHTQYYPGAGPGPFQEVVATAGTWRWNDDGNTGAPEQPLSDLQNLYGDYLISKLAITVGWTQGGYDLAGLLRWMQINGNRYTFGN